MLQMKCWQDETRTRTQTDAAHVQSDAHKWPAIEPYERELQTCLITVVLLADLLAALRISNVTARDRAGCPQITSRRFPLRNYAKGRCSPIANFILLVSNAYIKVLHGSATLFVMLYLPRPLYMIFSTFNKSLLTNVVVTVTHFSDFLFNNFCGSRLTKFLH